MNNQIAITRKLAQIAELTAEITALMECPNPKIPANRQQFLVDFELVEKSYPADAAPTRWITCTEVCFEMGIKPTRGNCSSVGSALRRLGFTTRRSNGKNIVFLPDLVEAY
ncbi:MAG: hypothetical protein ACRCUH_10185 [Shewanella sp.]